MHGFGIAQKIHVLSKEALAVEEGSLYPALYRMERDGWIEADWGTSELGRKAKFYNITAAGRRQLRSESVELARFMAAVLPVLSPA
jgi:transcriptional regulator